MLQTMMKLAYVGLWLCSMNAYADHALALGYEPKYPPNFSHFDYVNPDAPKSGRLTIPALGGFDTLNPFTLKGQAAAGVQTLVLETLAVRSLDEPFTMYGLLAKDLMLAKDGLSITFTLDERARFSNGDPVLAEDVKHSFEVLTQDRAAHPMFKLYWRDVKAVKVLNARQIRFEFKQHNSELHLILCELPVFSRKWASQFSLDKEKTRPPIGSGAYEVSSFEFGKQITFVRRHHHWATNHPTQKGSFNFKTVRFYYLLDDSVRLEAFKAGEFDFIVENVAKNWARGYVGEKFQTHQLKKAEFKHSNPQGMQGFVMNLRRSKFQNRKVREALNLAFDFEWLNRQLFYKQYQRSHSYFSNSELMATGFPDSKELKLLLPLKSKLPKEVFDLPIESPKVLNEISLRKHLIRAKNLLKEAGWEIKNGKLTNQNGEIFKIEFLLYSRTYERILAAYQRNLARLGIELTTRLVDMSIYQRRLNQFDFDMTMTVYPMSVSPGNEMLHYFSSESANEVGGYNLAGLRHSAIDALLTQFTQFKTRDELRTASRALDRVLRAEYVLIPNWYSDRHKIAWANRFEFPEKLPIYFSAQDWIMRTWWEKAREK